MLLRPQDNKKLKYLELIDEGRLDAALDLLKEIDNSEMRMEVRLLSCRYNIIVVGEIINFSNSEKLRQLNLLSLAMVNVINYYGYPSEFPQA